MRSLFFLLMLLPHSSIAFSMPSTRAAAQMASFGGQRTWRQSVSSRSVSWKQPSNDGIAAANALTASIRLGDAYKRGNIMSRVQRWVSYFRTTTRSFLLTAFFAFSLFVSAASAVSGGRAGGSFGKSHSPSSSGSSTSIHRSSPSRGYPSRGYSSRLYYSPGIRMFPYRTCYPPSTRVYHSVSYDAPVRRVSAADLIVLGGTGLLVYSAFSKATKSPGSALGSGASVASMTVCLNVPDRDNFYSILSKLKRLVESADTGTREGVQTLVASGMLLQEMLQ